MSRHIDTGPATRMPARLRAVLERGRTTETPHVLVVDDEAALAEEIADGLRADGFRAEWTADPRQVFGLLDLLPAITVVISDVRMPGISGLELACRLLTERPAARAVAVILISANARIDLEAGGACADMIDYLPKPIRRKDIARRVRAAHARAHAKREGSRALPGSIRESP